MADWLDEVIDADQENLPEFASYLSVVEERIKDQGPYAGLHEGCQNTGFVMKYHDGYFFIEYEEVAETEDDSKGQHIRLIKCNHDEDLDTSLPY